MQTCALGSGSSGNSFFVQANGCSFLIDAGLSRKQIVQRMRMIGKEPSQLAGIFISHEHSDHIRGVDVLARKYSIPVYVTKGCYSSCWICSDDKLINIIEKDKAITLGGVEVLPFSKNHDATDPVSYAIMHKDRKISIMTDIGVACQNIIKHTQESNVIFLESNHDITMLENGPYPAYLKKRIASDNGHLSNYHAALLILQYATRKLRHLVLSHLSENNNTEELALQTMNSLIINRKDLDVDVIISGRHNPTKLIQV